MPRFFCTPTDQLSDEQLRERSETFHNLNQAMFGLFCVAGIGATIAIATQAITFGWVCMAFLVASVGLHEYTGSREKADREDLTRRTALIAA